MRAITIAVLLCAFGALTASADVGVPQNDRGKQDTCAENNAKTPGSCVQLPPGVIGAQSGVVVYIDTGRADGRPGLWEEDNKWSGLQKIEFYGDGVDKIPADHLLL